MRLLHGTRIGLEVHCYAPRSTWSSIAREGYAGLWSLLTFRNTNWFEVLSKFVDVNYDFISSLSEFADLGTDLDFNFTVLAL